MSMCWVAIIWSSENSTVMQSSRKENNSRDFTLVKVTSEALCLPQSCNIYSRLLSKPRKQCHCIVHLHNLPDWKQLTVKLHIIVGELNKVIKTVHFAEQTVFLYFFPQSCRCGYLQVEFCQQVDFPVDRTELPNNVVSVDRAARQSVQVSLSKSLLLIYSDILGQVAQFLPGNCSLEVVLSPSSQNVHS